MKFVPIVLMSVGFIVLPRMREWIEIEDISELPEKTPVLPRMREWIEMSVLPMIRRSLMSFSLV